MPHLVGREALRRGVEVVAFALKDEARPDLAKSVSRIFWMTPEEVPAALKRLKEERIEQLVFAGGLNKLRWMKLLEREDLPSRGDDHLLNRLKDLLTSSGIEVVDPAKFLNDFIVIEGNLTGRNLKQYQEDEINFCLQMAKALGYNDIGQTVVVKDKVVLAVEAVEGTDAAIRRGASLGGAGVVVAKVARPGQDLRLDRPVIGIETIKTLVDVRAAALAIEAKAVLFLDREAAVRLAQKAGLSIVARNL